MNTQRARLFLIALYASLGFSGMTHAALLDGQTLNYQYYFPDLSVPYPNASFPNSTADNGNVIVGSGIEINNMADSIASIDISDSNILIDFQRNNTFGTSGPGTFNGWVLTDVFENISDFTSVTIGGLTNVAGFDSSRISFDANHIRVNWEGQPFNSGNIVSLNIASNVPEPATLALLSLGLFGFASARRGRQK